MFRIHDILVWIRIRRSMPLTNGSRSGSGSCYFCHWPSRCQQKTNFLTQFFPGFRIRIRIRIRINLSCCIRIRIRTQTADPDPDPGGKKLHQINRKKDRIFIFWSAGCLLLRAEGFSCTLGVLYGGLGISKLQFLIKKMTIKFIVVNFFQF